MTEQIINITIDDLINGNLRDMEITAQFGVYRQAVKGLAEKLKTQKQECEELKEKLSRKKAVIDFASCPSYGYRDNDIEPTCTKTFCYDIKSCEYKTMIKYEQALTEIKEIAYELTNEEYTDFIESKQEQILQKISEVQGE